MKIDDLKADFKAALIDLYGVDETLSFFHILTERYFNLNRLEIAQSPQTVVEKPQLSNFFNALDQLKANVPIQYIIGETIFMDLILRVTPDTLIPRPETEELVQWVISDLSNSPLKKTILDIGTGTGCIAISLSKHLKTASVHALDISKEALEIAKENAVSNNVLVKFHFNDIKKNPDLGCFDIIVSNPPYVREQEKSSINANVLDNEPHLALFVPDANPLLFYRSILVFAEKKLKKDGYIYFEINEYLSGSMIQLLTQHRYTEIELRQDMFGKDRMLKAKRI